MNVAVIGAGSAEFSLKLVRDLCLTRRLRGSTVRLMDIDQTRLDGVCTLLRRYADEVGAEIAVQSTTERCAALAGADFIVNVALAAPNAHLFAGWKVGTEHGYRHGGSLHVMHDEAFWINYSQLSFFASLVEDMIDTCPNAWLLQLANPVFAGVTFLGRRYPQAKVVGLCHGFRDVYTIANTIGVGGDDLAFEVSGVNHFIWLTRLLDSGTDVLPCLENWINESARNHWAVCGLNDPLGPKQVDLYRRFGVLPIGDTGTWGGGSWGWTYHVDSETEARWQVDPALGWETKFDADRERVELIRDLARTEERNVTSVVPRVPSGEVIVPMIEAIACDVSDTFVGNVMNSHGGVPAIPHDCAVETPVLVDAEGVRPLATTALPAPVVAAALRDYVAPVNLELAAFEERSRSLLVELVLTDPWTESEDQARDLVNAILALPEHLDMREHYQ